MSNPAAILPSSEHQKLLQEFERVKESENGWKDCIQMLVSPEQNSNDHTKFFCMQVVENYLKTRYKSPQVSDADQNLLKQFMSQLLQQQVNRKANEKNFLTRKAAQLFALVSLIDFPHRWPSFFNDLMVTSQWSVGNADFYLKCLMAIHSEIVDREIPHTPDELNLITFYKDAVRQSCVNQLVESWFLLLKEHSNKNAEITCQTLEVIGAYISWIEINLIVNDRFVQFFTYALDQVDLRETTCTCLEEIINKGMDVNAKLKLIDFLWLNVIQQHAMNLERQKSFTNEEQDDCDYLLKFGKLLNTIGTNLFEGWQKVNRKEPDTANLLAQSIELKLPFVLLLLNHADDDISECVSEYCMHYIGILKQNKMLTREQQANIENMLNIIINKTKYDSSFNFDHEGEDEAMFLEYRKNIKLVFDSIAQLDNDLVLATVKNLVIDTTANWPMKSYADIENALYLLFVLAEAIPSSQGNHFQPRQHKSDCLCQMIQATITSNLVQNHHRIVKLQYFENLARYYRFFQLYPQFVESVVDHFIGPHGLHNPDPKLRSRVSYLFCRYTKDLKNLVSNYVEKILNTVQDLLVIWSPLQSNSTKSGGGAGDSAEQQGALSSDDQLFLYETVSVLIVTGHLAPEIKAQLMKSLLEPTVASFPVLMAKYCELGNSEHDEKVKLVYANCLYTVMAVASRSSKGFSNQYKVKDCQCVEIFLEILRIFMPAISITTHKSLIHSGIRQYFHRMIVCLDNEVLEYLPLTIEHLLKINNEPKDLHDLFPLINQILSKYKLQIVQFMQHILMQLVNSIINYVNGIPNEIIINSQKAIAASLGQLTTSILTPATAAVAAAAAGQAAPVNPSPAIATSTLLSSLVYNSHSAILSLATNIQVVQQNELDAQLLQDVQILYKSYFQFLLNIVNNELMDIIACQDPNDVYKIFFTLLQGALLGFQDTPKVCFQIIRKFITVFVEKKNIPNFVQYTMENVVPCCFQIFIRQAVDLNDAQQVLVFTEIGQSLILLYSKFGDDFIKYLEFTYLPTIQLNSQVIQAILQSIKTNNPKGLKSIRESLQQMMTKAM